MSKAVSGYNRVVVDTVIESGRDPLEVEEDGGEESGLRDDHG